MTRDPHRTRHPRLRSLTVALTGRSETALLPWVIPVGTALLTAVMVMVVTHSLELYVSVPVAVLSAAVMGGMSAAYLENDDEDAAPESDGPGGGGGGGGGRPRPDDPRDGGGGRDVAHVLHWPAVTVTQVAPDSPRRVAPAGGDDGTREREPVPAGPPSRERR